MVGLGRRAEFSLAAHLQAGCLHEPGDPCSADLFSLVHECSLNTGSTVGAPTTFMNRPNGFGQGDVLDLVAVFWPSPPRKIATDPDVECPTQNLDAVLVTMLLDKLIDQFPLAKKASAFFKMSRS